MARRHLPVLSVKDPATDAERSRWSTIAVTATISFLTWLPLVAVVLGILGKVRGEGADPAPDAAPRTAEALLVLGLLVGSFVLAHGIGGHLGRRLGASGGSAAPALGGALSALMCWAAAVAGGALPSVGLAVVTLALLATMAAGSASGGARIGIPGPPARPPP